jgi:hypothetical protein
VPPDALIGQIIQKIISHERKKELGHSENGPWDFVGTIRRPGQFSGCYFRSFGAKKLLVPMWGLKRNPLYGYEGPAHTHIHAYIISIPPGGKVCCRWISSAIALFVGD